MSDTAIRIEGISKQYRIGTAAGGMFQYKSLRDSLGGLVRRPMQALRDRQRLTDDNSFWALKDVSFEVKKGEVVGIIGRNGAGKSTLLKILSRITKPTTGHIELHGRVGSLLEVGTGFHPELSGRENIYLNGAILGMTRAEVRAKFDEIVAFSEIERFLDTPVKQYSSGMYTRLAFAVAAHLEPEILVVDEVLAVGDAAFQKKCLGKMKDVAGEGRTVLFVSHNMAAVVGMCKTGVLLMTGALKERGAIDIVMEQYLTELVLGGGYQLEPCRRANAGRLRVEQVGIEDGCGNRLASARSGVPLSICFDVEVTEATTELEFAFGVKDSLQNQLFWTGSRLYGRRFTLGVGRNQVRCTLPTWPFREGQYFLNVEVSSSSGVEDWLQDIPAFETLVGDLFGEGRMPPPGWGRLLLPAEWATQPAK